jgi:hypothetical protein
MQAQKFVSFDFSSETKEGANSGLFRIIMMYGRLIAVIQ